MQPFQHQTLPTDRLHNLEYQVTLFRETDLELETAVLAAKASVGHRGWGEVEDLERADPKTEEPVHCFFVIGCDDADFGDGA